MFTAGEALVDRHIGAEMLRFHVLHLNHFAHQPGKFTGTVLHSLVTHIKDAVQHRDTALRTLDIEEAFEQYLFLSYNKSCWTARGLDA